MDRELPCPECGQILKVSAADQVIQCQRCGLQRKVTRKRNPQQPAVADPLGDLSGGLGDPLGFSRPSGLGAPTVDLPDSNGPSGSSNFDASRSSPAQTTFGQPTFGQPNPAKSTTSKSSGPKTSDRAFNPRVVALAVGGVVLITGLLVAVIVLFRAAGDDAADLQAGTDGQEGWAGDTYVIAKSHGPSPMSIELLPYGAVPKDAEPTTPAENRVETVVPSADDHPLSTARWPRREIPDAHVQPLTLSGEWQRQLHEASVGVPYPPVLADLSQSFAVVPRQTESGSQEFSEAVDLRDGSTLGTYPPLAVRGFRSRLSPDGQTLITFTPLRCWRLNELTTPLWTDNRTRWGTSRIKIAEKDSRSTVSANVHGASFLSATELITFEMKQDAELVKRDATTGTVEWRLPLDYFVTQPKVGEIRLERVPMAVDANAQLAAIGVVGAVLIVDLREPKLLAALPLDEAELRPSYHPTETGFLDQGRLLCMVQRGRMATWSMEDGSLLSAVAHNAPLGRPVEGPTRDQAVLLATFRKLNEHGGPHVSGGEPPGPPPGGTDPKWKKPYHILNARAARIHWPTGKLFDVDATAPGMIGYRAAGGSGVMIRDGRLQPESRATVSLPTLQPAEPAKPPESWIAVSKSTHPRRDWMLPHNTNFKMIAGGEQALAVLGSKSSRFEGTTMPVWSSYPSPGMRKTGDRVLYRPLAAGDEAKLALTKWLDEAPKSANPTGDRLAVSAPSVPHVVDIFTFYVESNGRIQPPSSVILPGKDPVQWIGWRDDKTLVTLNGGELRAWDAQVGSIGSPVWAIGQGYQTPVKLSEDRSLLFASGPNRIDLFELASGECRGRIKTAAHVGEISISGDNQLLAYSVAGEDDKIYVVDLTNGTQHQLRLQRSSTEKEKTQAGLAFAFWQDLLLIQGWPSVLVNARTAEVVAQPRRSQVASGRGWRVYGPTRQTAPSNVLDLDLSSPPTQLNIPQMAPVRVEVTSFDKTLAAPAARQAAAGAREVGAELGDGGYTIRGKVYLGTKGRLDLGAPVRWVGGTRPTIPSVEIDWEILAPSGTRCGKGHYSLPGEFRQPALIQQGRTNRVEIRYTDEDRQRIIQQLIRQVRSGPSFPMELRHGYWFTPRS